MRATSSGTGNTLNNVITGNDGSNTLSGLGGNDTLNGGLGNDMLDGGTGSDAMAGGAGSDTYVVDVAGDSVTENLNQGTDTVRTALAAYTLGANVENLTFTGTVAFSGTGNGLDNTILGGTGNDTLNGGAGDDTLSGGAGADTMIGGTGNDTYIVDNTGDVVDRERRPGHGHSSRRRSAIRSAPTSRTSP